MKYFDIKLEELKERERTLKNIDKYLQKIKSAASKQLPDAKIYLFGSYLTKKFSKRSDVDIAIVSSSFRNNLDERARILNKIKEFINFNLLFEIHLLTPKEFKFYKRFIKKLRRLS